MGKCVNSDTSYLRCNSAMWNRTGFAHSSQGGTLSIMEGQCYAPVDAGFPGLDTNINELIMAAKILEYVISLARRLLARETHTLRALPTNWLSKIIGMGKWVYQKVWMKASGGQKAGQEDPRVEQGKSTVEEMAPEEYGLIGAVTGLMHTNMEPYLLEGSDCSETAEGVFSMRGSEDMPPLQEEHREKAAFLSCTNPLIHSMVCWPTEDEDSSDWSSESEDEDAASGETVSLEGKMNDVQDVLEERIETQKEEDESSGTSVCWFSASKDNMNDSFDSVSDWSDDSDDDGVGTSWDSGDEASCKDEAEDLWLSFCRSDDPYNPFTFAVPTPKSIQTSDMQGPGLKNTPGACHTHSRLEEPNSENLVHRFHVPPKPFTKGHVQQANTRSAYHSNCLQTKASTSAIATKASEDNHGCNSCPTKKVRFSPVIKVHPMIAWSYAHRAARRGPWEEHARDRCRFQRRITETESAIGYCLDPAHRELVWARLHGSLDMGVEAICARDQLS